MTNKVSDRKIEARWHRRWMATAAFVGVVLLAAISVNAIRGRTVASAPTVEHVGPNPPASRAGESERDHPPAASEVGPQTVPENPALTTEGTPSAEAETPPVGVSPADESHRRKITGDWTRNYSGAWTMTINEDGTGKMTVQPDSIWSLVVGSKITIDMTWKIEDGKVIFDSIRGEPESSFNVVKKLWKVHQERKIIEVSDERFVYLSDDGKSESKWTRQAKE